MSRYLIILILMILCLGLLSNLRHKNISKFVSLFPHTLYINLKHRTDRSKEFLANFDPLRPDLPVITRIEAVPNKENGAIGCLQSHILALEYIIKHCSSKPYALICEDDLHIEDIEECQDRIEDFIDSGTSWDVLMLAHNTQRSTPTQLDRVIKILESQTGSAYLVKLSYAPKLLEVFKRDYDTYVSTKKWESSFCNDQSWKILQNKDNWYALEPAAGVQRASFSDIQQGFVDYKV